MYRMSFNLCSDDLTVRKNVWYKTYLFVFSLFNDDISSVGARLVCRG